MPGVNRVQLIGRLGADPEHYTTAGGKPICKFRVATDSGYGDNVGLELLELDGNSVADLFRAVRIASPRLYPLSAHRPHQDALTLLWERGLRHAVIEVEEIKATSARSY